jgi:hypothetical protein
MRRSHLPRSSSTRSSSWMLSYFCADHLHLRYNSSSRKSWRSWSRRRSLRPSLGPSCRDRLSSSIVTRPCSCACACIAPRSVLVVRPQPMRVAILVLHLLRTVGDEVSWLAALEACPCRPPCVLPVLVQPLEPSGQQCQLVLSKHVELLVWRRHQRGQNKHPGGWVSVRISI